MSRSTIEWMRGPNVPRTHVIDANIYRDAEIFEAEKKNIFDKVWLPAVFDCEVEGKGDYRALNVGGKPIIVIRGEDNKVRAFYNACSHRGAQLVRDPKGNAKTLRCFFHLWAFDTQGNCTSITRDEGYANAGCRKEDFGLKEVRAAVQHGLVFVNFDDDAEPLSDYLGPAFEKISAIFDSEPLSIFHFHEVVLRSNWKNWQEINSEFYHEYLHVINRKTSMREKGYFERVWLRYQNGHASVEGPPLFVDYSKQAGWSNRREGKPLPSMLPNEMRVIDLWPVSLVVVRDSAVRMDTMVPLSPTRTLLRFWGIGLKSDTQEDRRGRIRAHNQFWGPFGRNLPEDNLACESQAENINSGTVHFGLMAREEGNKAQDDVSLRHFYGEWARRMKLAPPAASAKAPSGKEAIHAGS
jgi:phenylpropionate dioxygenase-like ring-hydroxylating dioxygenase large terminal subunit